MWVGMGVGCRVGLGVGPGRVGLGVQEGGDEGRRVGLGGGGCRAGLEWTRACVARTLRTPRRPCQVSCPTGQNPQRG